MPLNVTRWAFKMKTFNVCSLPTCISYKQTRQIHNKISSFRFRPSTESLFLSGHPPVVGTIPACVRRFYPRVGGFTGSRKGGVVGEQQPIRRRHRPRATKAPRASPPHSERCCFPSDRIRRRLASPPRGDSQDRPLQSKASAGFVHIYFHLGTVLLHLRRKNAPHPQHDDHRGMSSARELGFRPGAEDGCDWRQRSGKNR